MDKEKKDKLIKYLNKKNIQIGIIDDDSIDIIYGENDITLTIRLIFYSKYIKYSTLNINPKYKNRPKYVTYYRNGDWRRRGGEVRRRAGGDDIKKLKTNFSRTDFNSAVHKNILLIQTWLYPILEEKKKTKEELIDYASELKFYFEDKYGDVKLSIRGDEIKHITAEVTNNEGATEYHNMLYENGNYFLESINTYWNWRKEKKVYKQREKIKK